MAFSKKFGPKRQCPVLALHLFWWTHSCIGTEWPARFPQLGTGSQPAAGWMKARDTVFCDDVHSLEIKAAHSRSLGSSRRHLRPRREPGQLATMARPPGQRQH